MTLVEVLVAIGIFVLGIEGFTLLFVKSWQSNSFILEEGQSSLLVSRAVTGIVSDLRRIRQSDAGEYPIKSGGDFDLVVFVDIDNDGVTEKVHYFLGGTDLKRGVTKPVGTPAVYPAGDSDIQVLAGAIVNNPNQPIFYYYNKNYPGDLANNPLSTPIQVNDARLIKVHLLINIDPAKAPNNVNIESFAQLRNINDYVQ